MQTTAGSLALEGNIAAKNFIVKQLRKAGAVILGKTTWRMATAVNVP
jgi:amidase